MVAHASNHSLKETDTRSIAVCEVTVSLGYIASHPGLHTKQNRNNPTNKEKIVMRI